MAPYRTNITCMRCLQCLMKSMLPLSLLRTLTLRIHTPIFIKIYKQTASIRVRRRVTRRLTRMQVAWHSDNIFSRFWEYLMHLKVKADEKFSRGQLIRKWRIKLLQATETELAWTPFTWDLPTSSKFQNSLQINHRGLTWDLKMLSPRDSFGVKKKYPTKETGG